MLKKLKIHQFWLLGGITLLCLCTAFAADGLPILVLPIMLIGVIIAAVDFKKLYLLLFLAIPISTEITVGGGLALGLPTEPLMAGLMLVTIVYALLHPKEIDARFIMHPVIAIILLQLAWLVFSTFFSVDMLVSVKFILAKLWFVVVFVFLTGILVKKRSDFTPVFWIMFIPLVILTGITIVRHGMIGFGFDTVNQTLSPYFNNHVNYAACITLFLPFAWYMRKQYAPKTIKRLTIELGMLVLLTGTVFAFTRGAWLALACGVAMYFIMKLKLVVPSVIVAVLGVGLVLGTLMKDNRYINFSPDFHQTIYHANLADHMAATMIGQDVSSAERLYRWVAAWYLFLDSPIVGHGAGNFYPEYKHHTVPMFETYTSENKEKSTVHNYFLLTMCEQGLPALLLYVALLIGMFLYGQRIYHRSNDPMEKRWIMSLVICLTIILVQNSLSDLIEVDKIGTMFYLCIALIVVIDLKQKREMRLQIQ